MGNEKRLIDANAWIERVKEAYCPGCENYNGVRCRACWIDDAIGLVEDAPTVDAVEVVRCKDCENLCPCGNDNYICVSWGSWTDLEGWCCKGERKTMYDEN